MEVAAWIGELATNAGEDLGLSAKGEGSFSGIGG